MKLNKLLIVYILYFLFTGCSIYSFKGSIPSHLNNIAIKKIINETSEYFLSESLNNELLDGILKQNLLSISSLEKADCTIDLKIKRLLDEPELLNESDTNVSVKQWKIILDVEVVWYDLVNQKDILNTFVSETVIYSLVNQIDNQSIQASSRQEAIDICLKQITDRILNELTSTW